MHKSWVLGVDIGTGSVKAVAVDFAAKVMATAQEHYTAPATPYEQDAAQVFTAFVDCVKRLTKDAATPPAAMVFSSAMHSLLAVDKNSKALMPASLWSDTRSRAVAENLRQTALGKALYRATGTPVHSMSPLCKLRWMREQQPALFNAAHKFISLKEFVWYQLFGEYKIDHSLASATGLFDVHNLRWHDEALAFAGVSAAQLSEPVSTAYENREMNPAVASAMDLPAATPVIIGGSDGCLANLGSRCLNESTAALTIGTSAAVRLTTKQALTDDNRMIFTYRLDEQTFVCGGATNNGGNVLQWLLKRFQPVGQQAAGYDGLFTELGKVPAGSEGLLFLPYLHGERAPVWDEQSCGVFFGIRSAHTQTHFTRAAMEGLCFALKEILQGLEDLSGPVQQIRCSGGAASHPVLLQTLADVTGRPVHTDASGDASALGAAYLALKKLGVITRYTDIAAKASTLFQPNKAAVEIYGSAFAVYKQLYPALKDSMHLLQQQTNG